MHTEFFLLPLNKHIFSFKISKTKSLKHTTRATIPFTWAMKCKFRLISKLMICIFIMIQYKQTEQLLYLPIVAESLLISEIYNIGKYVDYVSDWPKGFKGWSWNLYGKWSDVILQVLSKVKLTCCSSRRLSCSNLLHVLSGFYFLILI